MEFGIDAFLEKYVNFERLDDSTAGIDADRSYENTYEEGLAFEYRINKMILVSTGFNLTQIGQKKSSTLDISAPGGHADYWSAGIGTQVEPVSDLKINVSLGYTSFINSYKNSDYYDSLLAAYGAPDATKEYNKKYVIIALGAEYKFI